MKDPWWNNHVPPALSLVPKNSPSKGTIPEAMAPTVVDSSSVMLKDEGCTGAPTSWPVLTWWRSCWVVVVGSISRKKTTYVLCSRFCGGRIFWGDSRIDHRKCAETLRNQVLSCHGRHLLWSDSSFSMLPSQSFGDRPFDMQERQQVLVHADQYSTPNWLLNFLVIYSSKTTGIPNTISPLHPWRSWRKRRSRNTRYLPKSKKKHGFKPQIVEKQGKKQFNSALKCRIAPKFGLCLGQSEIKLAQLKRVFSGFKDLESHFPSIFPTIFQAERQQKRHLLKQNWWHPIWGSSSTHSDHGRCPWYRSRP